MTPPPPPLRRHDVEYPGRICLLGEHCDWYGGASLTVPLPLRLHLSARAAAAEGDRTGLTVRSHLDGAWQEASWPLGTVDRSGGPLRFVAAASAALLAQGIALPPAIQVEITSTLPMGRGFSSSAACALAALDGLSRLAGIALSAATLADLAFQVEHELLGIGCGRLDPLACAADGPAFFRWPAPPPVAGVPLVLGGPLYLVAGVFSAPRDTPGILAALRGPHPGIDLALRQFAALAEAGAAAVRAGDAAALGAAMDAAQHAYEVHLAGPLPALAAPRLTETCRWLRHEGGALGAKFSGAGGEGSFVAIFGNEASMQNATAALAVQGMDAWAVPIPALPGRATGPET